MDRDAATYDDSGDEVAPDEEDIDVDPDVAVGPRFVELEPFPQDVFDEFKRLQNEEEEAAQTFDYVPTSVDDQGHGVDQFGIRIQRTTRPPYVPPVDWVKMRPADKRKAIDEFEVGAANLKQIRQRSATCSWCWTTTTNVAVSVQLRVRGPVLLSWDMRVG